MDTKNQKRVPLSQFEAVAAANGYEVFTKEEIADYARENLMKSRAGRLSQEEKDVFTTDMMYLQKAVVSDENGEDVVRYYRKEQVAWEKSENGVLMKGLEGVYLDTPENRRLKRVGEAYVPSSDFMKSLFVNGADEELMKALQTGHYADTPANQKLGRVGEPFAKSYESKQAVHEREEKTKERLGGVKGDEKLHEDAKHPGHEEDEDEDEVKKRERNSRNVRAELKGTRNYMRNLKNAKRTEPCKI